ncbi:hypothetical protein [Methylobacterium sp. Leaf118]|uniref:hypothetical protein n=1 Tax=Methylobacterium sp. Leaf118 TaxID=2876562 RepID=UPI001E2839C2|nr:hypothetical protein [Methylobacterium sp. Leaf118]
MKKPARSGAPAGSSNLSLGGDKSEDTTRPQIFNHLRRRFGLAPATAAVIAELAYPSIDTWRGRA